MNTVTEKLLEPIANASRHFSELAMKDRCSCSIARVRRWKQRYGGRNCGAARSTVEPPKHDLEKCKDVCSTATVTVSMRLAIKRYFDDKYTPVNYVNGTSAVHCSAKPLWRMVLVGWILSSRGE